MTGSSPRGPRTIRLRTVMIGIAGIAVWLGLFRAAPFTVVVITLILGPTLACSDGYSRSSEADEAG